MNKYNTRVKGNCIAFALLIAGLTTTTLGTQASSSSDYLLVEDNFSSTQINSSASNIISESGFTDIQYISAGSTPTPVPTTPPPTTTTITTTPTPIPITQTPTTTSSTSSSSGGGGSDPLIIEKLSKQTIIPEDIHNSAQSPPPTSTPIPITQTSENTTPTSRPTTTPLPYPTHLPSSTTAVIPIPSITQTTQTHTNQQNNYSNTLTDITGDTEISEYINKNLKEKKNNISTEEQIFHNSATQQIEQEHITQTKTNEESNEESNEENAKFFCTASSFTTYALLLIIFLLGMIFQSILHKTFYTHKK